MALGMKKNSLDEFGQQFLNEDDRYLETLSYWLEHGSSRDLEDSAGCLWPLRDKAHC